MKTFLLILKKQFYLVCFVLFFSSIFLLSPLNQMSFAKKSQFHSCPYSENVSENIPFEYSIENLSLGGNDGAVVINDGNSDTLYTWGHNKYGQLGNGSAPGNNVTIPTAISFPKEAIEQPIEIEQISMGYSHSAAVIDNKLFTWGENHSSQLGFGEFKQGSDNGVNGNYGSPTEVTTLPEGEIEQISMGYNNSAAVVNYEGLDHLYTWGKDTEGQLGLGDDFDTNEFGKPQEVTTLPKGEIEQISMGYSHSAVIVKEKDDDENHLYTWGDNSYGQLGLGDEFTEDSYDTPQEVALPKGEIEQVALGDYFSVAITNDGTTDYLYTWGHNSKGQLGLGDNKDYSLPQEVTSLPKGNIEQISTGLFTSSVVINDGVDHLYTWGWNNQGQLGLGDEFLQEYYNFPQEVVALPEGDIEQIAIGGSGTGNFEGDNTNTHSAAVVNNGKSEALYTWGDNSYGQLGLGYAGDSNDGHLINTPQFVWETPYLENISSEVRPNPNSNFTNAELLYSFETDLDVKDVTIELFNSDEFKIDSITSNPQVDSVNKIFYSDKVIFSNLEKGKEYTYTITLNYLPYNDNSPKSIELANEDFTNEASTSINPEIEEIYFQNITKNSVELYFDLFMGYDKQLEPYELDEVIINDSANNEEYSFTKDELLIDDLGQGNILITNLKPDTTYNWDIAFKLSSPNNEHSTLSKNNNSFTTLETKWPSKWIIYLGGILFLIFLMLLVILIIYKIRKKWKENKLKRRIKAITKTLLKEEKKKQKLTIKQKELMKI